MKISGPGGISATIILDSINESGNRLTTFELVYPRIIHSEVMTHRMLSKNAASTRAVPIKKAIEHVKENPYFPMHWGKSQPGMQANEELDAESILKAKEIWQKGIDSVTSLVAELDELKCHKQYAARWLETPAMMKTIMTGTEWENLLWLRDHEAAQPEFRSLAFCIKKAMYVSTPKLLIENQWHLPYVESDISLTEQVFYDPDDGSILSLDLAQKVSASCCAQVSYRKLDDSLEKAVSLYDKLVGSDRKHSSAFEHAGTPIYTNALSLFSSRFWPRGVSHKDRDGNYWSGNYKGWVQFRKLIPGEAKW